MGQTYRGELNLRQSKLTLPAELKLAGKKVFYDLINGRIDIYPKGLHNPTVVVNENNVIDLKYKQVFKPLLGLKYNRKYPVDFTIDTKSQVLDQKLTIYKGIITI